MPFERCLEAGSFQARHRRLAFLLALADHTRSCLAIPGVEAPGAGLVVRLVISSGSGPPTGGVGLTPRLTAHGTFVAPQTAFSTGVEHMVNNAQWAAYVVGQGAKPAALEPDQRDRVPISVEKPR